MEGDCAALLAAGELEEPDSFAEMLENHELRRPGGVPLGPFCFSIELDRDSLLVMLEPLPELLLGEGSGWPLGCPLAWPFLASAFCCVALGVGDDVGIWRGCEEDLGGEEDLLSLSVDSNTGQQPISPEENANNAVG